jgi:hypothetical protein
MNGTINGISLREGLAAVIAMLFVAGCSSKNDAISNAEKAEKTVPASLRPKPSRRKVSLTACPS